MKKFLSMILALALVASLCAFAFAEESVTLTAWYYADEGAAEGYNLWAEQVKAAYPYISMEFEELPYDSGPEKFTVAVATNTYPDFYFDAYSRCAPAIKAGKTLDVTELREQYADESAGRPSCPHHHPRHLKHRLQILQLSSFCRGCGW